MGGLYNKLAQDWATRDGLIPQAWVDELKDSFEAMPPPVWKSKVQCGFNVRRCDPFRRRFLECGPAAPVSSKNEQNRS